MQLNRTRPPWIPEKKKDNKSWNTTTFNYNSPVWKKDRALHLKLNPLCVRCKAEGRTTPATIDDHIIPISQGGDPWNWDNRQGLCFKCHRRKTSEDIIKYNLQ